MRNRSLNLSFALGMHRVLSGVAFNIGVGTFRHIISKIVRKFTTMGRFMDYKRTRGILRLRRFDCIGLGGVMLSVS